MRDDFNEEVKRAIAARVAHRCSNPSCHSITSGPQVDPSKAVNLGVAAHITAASSGGPRFNRALTSNQRKHADNAIWLCQNCAKLIDNDKDRFTEQTLREWKQRTEAETLGSVGKPSHSLTNERSLVPESFFLGPVTDNLPEAREIAASMNLPIFMVIFDDNHPTKSKSIYSLGYFLEYNTTKRLVKEHFIQVLVSSYGLDVAQYVPVEDPLENCLLVVLAPDGTIMRREGVYANPDEGLKRTRKFIAAWEGISNAS